eukprot:6185531-Pleurochrysis_carterae.AAC.1
MNSTVLLVKQIFEQVEKSGLSVSTDIMSTEDGCASLIAGRSCACPSIEPCVRDKPPLWLPPCAGNFSRKWSSGRIHLRAEDQCRSSRAAAQDPSPPFSACFSHLMRGDTMHHLRASVRPDAPLRAPPQSACVGLEAGGEGLPRCRRADTGETPSRTRGPHARSPLSHSCSNPCSRSRQPRAQPEQTASRAALFAATNEVACTSACGLLACADFLRSPSTCASRVPRVPRVESHHLVWARVILPCGSCVATVLYSCLHA